ncbi:MAG TPA: GDP-mannose 4,6-dehydratase [bacterium]|nr:GDP-mannose 4,6-dehydratase [bacterium]
MKILITGNLGFIGSHLHKKMLNNGYEVKGIDNVSHPCGQIVESAYADVRYYPSVYKFVEWADVVFHLAAQINVDKSIDQAQETVAVNVEGTVNILDAVTKLNKKMIYASSSEIYGSSLSEVMNEDHALNPHSPYGASKAGADRLCKSYFTTYGTKVIIQRNFNVFGEYQNSDIYGAVIPKFINRALKNEPLEIFGDGNQERDFMYIQDALAAYEFSLKNELWGEELNFGTGATISINQLAEMVIKITGSKSNIIHTAARPGEIKRLCAGIEKAQKNGFKPQTDFERDLTSYVNWFKNK